MRISSRTCGKKDCGNENKLQWNPNLTINYGKGQQNHIVKLGYHCKQTPDLEAKQLKNRYMYIEIINKTPQYDVHVPVLCAFYCNGQMNHKYNK